MSDVLVIGSYAENDVDALNSTFKPLWCATPGEISSLEETARSAIKVVAFKGHLAFGASEMDQLPNLGLVANFGVGYDAINTVEASARGIKVTNTPDVLNDDVADLAVLLLLAHGRQFEQASQWARSGDWAAKGEYPLARKISGGKVGILGLGRIGREIANRMAAFKMDVHYFARSEKETPNWTYHSDPISLASAVDYLVVALVGGKETEGFVTKEVLEALGPRGIIVNISRGTTIDEEAMIQALSNGTLGGAALDVFLNEPKIDERFYQLDNVTIQPHQGSGTVETRADMGQLQRDNVSAFLAGTALVTPVN